MSSTDHNIPLAERVVMHEAGHAVAAVALELEFNGVTVEASRQALGCCEARALRPSPFCRDERTGDLEFDPDPIPPPDDLERLGCFALAGLAAEIVAFASFHVPGCSDDLWDAAEKAGALAREAPERCSAEPGSGPLNGFEWPDEVSGDVRRTMSRWAAEAEALVGERIGALWAVANALSRRRKMGKDEVTVIVAEAHAA